MIFLNNMFTYPQYTINGKFIKSKIEKSVIFKSRIRVFCNIILNKIWVQIKMWTEYAKASLDSWFN